MRDDSGAAVSDQVIREDPSAAWKRCRGTEKSAEDLVGPPEWMELERRSTAVVRGDLKHSGRQSNGRLRINAVQ